MRSGPPSNSARPSSPTMTASSRSPKRRTASCVKRDVFRRLMDGYYDCVRKHGGRCCALALSRGEGSTIFQQGLTGEGLLRSESSQQSPSPSFFAESPTPLRKSRARLNTRTAFSDTVVVSEPALHARRPRPAVRERPRRETCGCRAVVSGRCPPKGIAPAKRILNRRPVPERCAGA